MGMDPFEVQDFIENKGLAEYNVNIILDQMKNPGYVNVLRRQFVQGAWYGGQNSQVQSQVPMMGHQQQPPVQGYGQNVMMN